MHQTLRLRKVSLKYFRTIYDTVNLEQAEATLKELVAKYDAIAPKLAGWLENNTPEALTVFLLL